MSATQTEAKQTREHNQAAKAALYQERANATRAARQALQRVFERKDATPAEILGLV